VSESTHTRLSFTQATSIIAGYGIGGGVLAVPYLVSLNGIVVSTLVIIVAYAASLVLHLLIGEMCTGDGSGRQIVELYRKYLFTGKFGVAFTWIFFVVMGVVFLANLAAYVSGGDEVLRQSMGLPSTWGALAFYLVAASIAALGLKALGIAEQWAVGSMAMLFVVLALATIAMRVGAGGPAPAWGAAVSTQFTTPSRAVALFGMTMFCFSAFFSVPQAVAGLRDRPGLINKAIAAGLGINGIIILLVTVMSLIASDEVTQIATVGWARTLGPWAEAAGTAFVIIAMLTSYWSISFALSTMIEERLKVKRIVAWLIATLPTLFIAIAGFGGFLDFMRTAGGGIAILIAVLFLPAYHGYRKTRSGCSILPRLVDRAWASWFVALAYVAMAIGSIVTIG